MQKIFSSNVASCLILNLIKKSNLNRREQIIAEEYFEKVTRDREFSKYLTYLPDETLISIISSTSKIDKK